LPESCHNFDGFDVNLFQEMTTWKSGGTPSRSNKGFFNGNIPWYSSGELEAMYLANSKECITENALQHSAAKGVTDF